MTDLYQKQTQFYIAITINFVIKIVESNIQVKMAVLHVCLTESLHKGSTPLRNQIISFFKPT